MPNPVVLPEEDLAEIFIRSSGPGGQNVNKVSTAVCLRHIPTGIQVKCQAFRTQYQNRVQARRLLALAVQRRALAATRAIVDAREKARRKNRKRTQAAKKELLVFKKKRAQKKTNRARISKED